MSVAPSDSLRAYLIISPSHVAGVVFLYLEAPLVGVDLSGGTAPQPGIHARPVFFFFCFLSATIVVHFLPCPTPVWLPRAPSARPRPGSSSLAPFMLLLRARSVIWCADVGTNAATIVSRYASVQESMTFPLAMMGRSLWFGCCVAASCRTRSLLSRLPCSPLWWRCCNVAGNNPSHPMCWRCFCFLFFQSLAQRNVAWNASDLFKCIGAAYRWLSFLVLRSPLITIYHVPTSFSSLQ